MPPPPAYCLCGEQPKEPGHQRRTVRAALGGRPWVRMPPRAPGLLEHEEASKHRVLLLSTPGESRMLRSGSPDTAPGRKVNPKTVEMPQV